MISIYKNMSWKLMLGFILMFLLFLTVTQQSHAAEFSCNNVKQVSNAECEALVALYNSTGGKSWTRQNNWLENNTPCSWEGVRCSRYGNVHNLLLASNGLQGELPDEIGDLKKLYYLNLDQNRLYGAIPESVRNLTYLRKLRLDNNMFLGPIPTEIGNLSHLEQLTFHDTAMYGAIPTTLTRLSKLHTFTYSGTFICDPGDLGNFLKDLDNNGTLEYSDRFCTLLPSNVNSCGVRKPNFAQTPDAYSEIEVGDNIKWTYTLSRGDFKPPHMRVTVYFTCNRNGEEVILAQSTSRWHCGSYTPTSVYWDFTSNTQPVTCSGNGASIQKIVYEALKDNKNLNIKSPEDAIAGEFEVAKGDYFDIGVQFTPVSDCSSSSQTVYASKNTQFSIHYNSRGQIKPQLLVYNGSALDILSKPYKTLPNGEESSLYFKFSPGDRNAVYEEIYINGRGVEGNAYYNRVLKVNTQSSEIELGHSGKKNRFCGSIKSILEDPNAMIGSD